MVQIRGPLPLHMGLEIGLNGVQKGVKKGYFVKNTLKWDVFLDDNFMAFKVQLE